MTLRRYLYAAVFCILCLVLFSNGAYAQRQRVVSVPTSERQQIPSQVTKLSSSRPTTPPPVINRSANQYNQVVVRASQPQPDLIKKTGSSNPTNLPAIAPTTKTSIIYSANAKATMMNSIQTKLGIPYLYGSTGPNRYDCSGFVWSVFRDAGFLFERSSARTFWNEFEPVSGDERFKFGTLVFFNRLGHVGIVADENGFYHASSSKGITYSPFEGYWGKRIVGYRRVPLSFLMNMERQDLNQPEILEAGK